MTNNHLTAFGDTFLLRLAEAFKKAGVTLYVVGGAVRNALLSLPFSDVDVAAAVSAERAGEIARKAGFTVLPSSLRLGTLIFIKQAMRLEFTSFRKDSYPIGKGIHEPLCVEFVSDIETDAKRRDFKINAIYYDICEGKIVDPLSGCTDLQKRTISTVDRAEKVFSEDGLRLMRLARFAAQLDFSVDEQTLLAAREFSYGISDIARERILEELNKIALADTAYSISSPNAHYDGLRILNEINVTERILPELFEGVGMKQNPLYHRFDVFEHMMQTFLYSAQNVRYAALLHDIAKPLCMRRDSNVHAHAEEGAEMTQKIMRRMGFPTKTISETVWLVRWHMNDLEGNMRESKLKWFVAQNAGYIDKLILLKHADASGSAGERVLSESGLRLKNMMDALIEEGAPLSKKDLKVNGYDAVEKNIPEKMRSVLFSEIWKQAVLNPSMRTREAQLKFMENDQWK